MGYYNSFAILLTSAGATWLILAYLDFRRGKGTRDDA